MNVFHLGLYFFLSIWGLFYNWTFLMIYVSILGGYFFMASRIPDGKYNSPRVKARIAAWTEPLEGNIRARYDMDMTNAIAFLETLPKDGTKVTVTHCVIKAVAEILKNCPDINGKIAFGKYVPYDDVTVTCLVDVEGGKDLAALAIKDCDKMTIEEIANFIRERSTKVRKHQDFEHKKRTSGFTFVPTAVIKIIFWIVHFVANVLGIDVEALQVKKHAFGAATVTALGMLGIRDCWSPNNLILRGRMIVSVNEIEKRVVNVGGKIEVRPMMNLNFTVDHRFLDGARAKRIYELVNDVFQNVEKYSNKAKVQSN